MKSPRTKEVSDITRAIESGKSVMKDIFDEEVNLERFKKQIEDLKDKIIL